MKRSFYFVGKVGLAVAGLTLGGWLAFVGIQHLPQLQLPRNHPLLPLMGIRQHEVVGFLPYWLVGKTAADYSPYLTTLTYFGLGVKPDGTIQKKVNAQELEPGWNMLNKPALTQMLDEAKGKGMKLSLLVQNMNEKEIYALIADPENHARVLVNEVEPIMRERGFTDLNLDLESLGGASPSAQAQFAAFARKVKQELTVRHLGTLSVDIIATSLVKAYLIDPQTIGNIADYVIIMTYDYHYSGSFVVGPVAPLSGAGEVREFDVEAAIAAAEKVIPHKKLILGLPLYGYEWETIEATAAAGVIPGSGRTATNQRVAELLKDCPPCVTGTDQVSGERYVVYPDPKDRSYRVIYYGDATLMNQKLHEVEEWGGTALWALGYEADSDLTPLQAFKDQYLFFP